MSSLDYLLSPRIKNDSWIIDICSDSTAEELADLISQRIIAPDLYGPAQIAGELAGQIIYDLASNSYIDYDLVSKAMSIVMNKALKKDINTENSSMQNIFFIIEQLAIEDCAEDLYQWIVDNVVFMESSLSEDRRLFQEALAALAYAQKQDQIGVSELWEPLWKQEDPYWWNSAFHGIRYSNFDKAISLIPELMNRKCSNSSFLLMSIWRVKEDTRLIDFLKKGLKKDKLWAGLAINTLALRMKWAEKNKLIMNLSDPDVINKDIV